MVGCASSHQSTTISTQQATALAIQLANDKSLTLYNCQPFQKTQPARFESGRWVWAGQEGWGRCDIHAAVQIAADGSTNNVTLELLDNRNIEVFLHRDGVFQYVP